MGDVIHKLTITSHMKQSMCYNREQCRFGWGISILKYLYSILNGKKGVGFLSMLQKHYLPDCTTGWGKLTENFLISNNTNFIFLILNTFY